MDRQQLASLLAELPPGVLCTADDAGNANAAVFGSTQLLDDGRLIIGLGDNRTLKNLRQNPKAAFVAYAPGASVLDSKGIRLYLDLEGLEDQGERFAETVARIEQTAGSYAARRTRCVALFHIREIRPPIDSGP